MQDSNEPEETLNKTAESPAPPHIGGDIISPSSSTDTTPVTAPDPEPGLKPLNHPATDISTEPKKSAEPFITSSNHGKKGMSKKVLAILLVLILVAVGGGAWWYTQNNKSVKQVNTVNETQDIDILRIGNTEGPASVYFPDEGLLGVQAVMDHQIYEGLTGWDNKKVVPLIAQSWTNPDEKTWVFKIRPNVKFHTGKAVTAKEVKVALDDLKKFDYWSIFVSTIDTVEATGDLELTIKTKEPDALLLNRLSQALISDVTAADKAGNNGTGAYQVDTTAKNDEKSTTLVPFENYYGGHVKVRKLVFVIIDSDENLVKALNNKEIDVADTIPIPSIRKLVEGKNYIEYEYDAPGTFGVYMNQTRSSTSILKNKDIRKAIAQSIDRQGLINEVGNKNIPATQVIPKSLAGHDESIVFPKFDVEAAKASLAKAGYNNTPLEVLYVKELQQDTPVIIKQLKAAGFKITEKAFVTDNIDDALKDLKAGKFDLFFAGFTSDVFDARDLLGALLGSTESTYPTLEDPVYDKLLVDSDKEFDPVKRIELLQKANKYILDELAWIPVRNSHYVSYYAKDIDIKQDFNGGGDIGAYYRKTGRIVQ